MSLYFFHLRDGQDVLLDPEGREIASLAEVQRATLREARSIISADAQAGTIKLSFHLDVEDGAGTIVHSLQFEDAVVLERGPWSG